MFMRKRNVIGPNGYQYTYYGIVESVLVDGKPRQKMLYNMGTRKTIAECIDREQERLDYWQKQDQSTLSAMGAIGGFRLPPMHVAEMRARYQKQIEFLKDAATKLRSAK
jgi:hypothetical protein